MPQRFRVNPGVLSEVAKTLADAGTRQAFQHTPVADTVGDLGDSDVERALSRALAQYATVQRGLSEAAALAAYQVRAGAAKFIEADRRIASSITPVQGVAK